MVCKWRARLVRRIPFEITNLHPTSSLSGLGKHPFHSHKSRTFAPFRFFDVLRRSRSLLKYENLDEATFVVSVCLGCVVACVSIFVYANLDSN